jgi:hypothetical protein
MLSLKGSSGYLSMKMKSEFRPHLDFSDKVPRLASEALFLATMRATAAPEVASMKVAQVPKPGADFEIVQREIPKPDYAWDQSRMFEGGTV